MLMIFIIMDPVYSFGGSETLEFVLKDYNARSQGMGGALTGFASGVEAIHYNPAGLHEARYPEIFTVHGDLGFDRRINGLEFSLKTHKLGIGFGWNRFSIDSIPVTEETIGSFIGNLPDGSLLNQVSIVDWAEDITDAYIVALGYPISRWLSIGGSFKYFRRGLYEFNASGSTMDLGFKLNYHPRVKLGMSFKNIFGEMEWDHSGRRETIAGETVLGLGYKFSSFLTAACDFVYESEKGNHVNMGLEGVLKDLVFLRVGTQDGKSTFGAGVNLSNWRIDYAYNKDDLGTNHKISAKALFFDWEYPFEKKSRRETRKNRNKKKEQEKLSEILEEEDLPRYGDLITDIARIPASELKLINDHYYIPVRLLALFGIQKGQYEKAKMLNLKKDKVFVMAKAGESNVLVNGKKWHNMEFKIKRVNKELYVPPEILTLFAIEYEQVK